MRRETNSVWRFTATLALLLLGAGFWFLQVYGTARPQVIAASASTRLFSAERAEQVLARLLGPEKPHPVSTDENARVRARIVRELSALGLKPFGLHGFACRSPHNSGVLICGSVNDVIAQVKPGVGKAIVMLAHYDSVPAGPGAADDESGVATVIETARALIARGLPGKHPVLALLTDGEEADLLGAAAFLRDAKLRARVGAVVNVEARGNRGPSLLFQTSPGNAALIDLYAKNVPEYATSSLYSEIYRFLPNDTDLTLFIADGFPSLNFAYVGGVADYHTARDIRANLDPASLQHHGDSMLGVVNGLENVDFGKLHDRDCMYFDILGRWLPRAPARFAIPFALLAFVAILAAGLFARVERFSRKQWLRAFAITPALILGALFSGFLLHAIASLISGMSDPVYAYPAVFRVALAFSLGGSALLVSRLAPTGAAIIAAWLWFAALGLAAAIMLRGLSLYFLLPSLVAATLLLTMARIPLESLRLAAVLFAALVAFLCWSSIGALGEMLMGLKLHPLFTVPFALALSTLVPLLSRYTLPRPLWLTSTGAFFALAIIAAAVQGFEPTFSIVAPQRLSITYLQDRSHAEWAVDSFAPVPKAMLAIAQFSAKPQRTADIAPLSYVAPAGAPRFALPAATVIARPLVNGLRRVTIDLGGSKQTAQMYVTVPDSVRLKSVDIKGWHFDAPPGWSTGNAIAIACMTRDCADASLTLTLASRVAANVGIYEHRFGLPDFARSLVAARPRTAAPSQNGDGITLVSSVLIPAAQ
ncbi:MAG TPA: M28 family peptidase [Rhizomicrobium sp.]|jgi:hypothetical protein|nr:M28 family peptidase [Rhizomicrobium sp.]